MKTEDIKFVDVRIYVNDDTTCTGDVFLIPKDNRLLGRRFEGIPLEKMGFIVDRLIKNTTEEL